MNRIEVAYNRRNLLEGKDFDYKFQVNSIIDKAAEIIGEDKRILRIDVEVKEGTWEATKTIEPLVVFILKTTQVIKGVELRVSEILQASPDLVAEKVKSVCLKGFYGISAISGKQKSEQDAQAGDS